MAEEHTNELTPSENVAGASKLKSAQVTRSSSEKWDAFVSEQEKAFKNSDKPLHKTKVSPVTLRELEAAGITADDPEYPDWAKVMDPDYKNK